MKQTCILVLGMHRSGTSALSGVLNTLGISMGKQLLLTKTDNPKGHFENERIMYFNDQSLLPLQESSWDDLRRLAAVFDYPELVNQAKSIIQEDYSALDIFGIKDPRMCVLMPFWKPVLEQSDVEIKMILPYRHPLEVASSLQRRDGFSVEKGLLLWTRHVLYAEYYSRGHKRVFTTYTHLLQNTMATLTRIEAKLAISFPIAPENAHKELTSFLEKDLKHHESTLKDLPSGLPEFIVETANAYEMLGNDEWMDDNVMHEKFDTLREQYNRYTTLFYNSDMSKKSHAEATHFIQLFINQGHGYSEENSIKFPVAQHTQIQEFTFDLSDTSNIKALRLDPLNDACVIEIESLHVKKENKIINLLTYISSNAEIHHGASCFFTTEDPQICFNALEPHIFENASSCVVVLRYAHIAEDALYVSVKQTKAELDQTKAELDQTKAELDQTKAELVSIYLSKSWRMIRPLRKLKRITRRQS